MIPRQGRDGVGWDGMGWRIVDGWMDREVEILCEIREERCERIDRQLDMAVISMRFTLAAQTLLGFAYISIITDSAAPLRLSILSFPLPLHHHFHCILPRKRNSELH